MPTIIEENLTFTFPVSWRAEKFDATNFYTKHFQKLASSKAVDIVVLTSANVLWLIEVKDYRANRRSKTLDVFTEVVAKVRDTLAGLIVLQRRTADTLQPFAARLTNTHSFRVALHFEQPAKHSKLYPVVVERANAKLKFRQAVRVVDPRAIFCEIGAMPSACEWQVSRQG